VRPEGSSWSLAARLTAWYALSSFTLIMTATGLLYWALADSLNHEHDLFLADKVHVIRELLRHRPASENELKEEVEASWAPRQYAQVFVRILDLNGHVMVESPGMAERLPSPLFPPPSHFEDTLPQGVDVSSKSGRPYRIIAAEAAVGPSPEPTRLIQVALNTVPERALLAGFRRRLWIVLSAALLVCLGVGYEIARQGIRPINKIAATARRVGSATLHERIDVRGLPGELSALAGTFNAMLDRLEDAFARLSRFSADIAHELRTPVNNLRGQTEVALSRARTPAEYRDTLSSALEETVRLSRIIEALLFLARAEDPRSQVETESLDITTELESVREFYDAAAADAGIDLRVQGYPNLHADLDRTLFQRAVGNLGANALAPTPSGGSVTISLAPEPDRVRIEVADTGVGIPPEHLPHILDRFYRADAARSTSPSAGPGGNVGLGLAIVRSIAALHGGSLDITSQMNQGTRVTLRFPRHRRR
jgi:two-component system heavy metal sensor histidine kinase CusS